jgi:hypothetical protein
MPTFKFTGPDGKQYTVNGPDGATEQQAFQMLQSQISAAKPSTAPAKGFGEQLNDAIHDAPRQLGLTARYGLEGVGGTFDALIGNPLRTLTAPILGNKPAANTGKALADLAHLPEPATAGERVVGDATRMLAGGAVPVAAAGRVAEGATGVTRAVARQLASNPLRQLVSAGAAGAAGGYTRETGGDAASQLVASLAVGVAAPAAMAGAQRGVNTLQQLARGAAEPTQAQIDIQIARALGGSGLDVAQINPGVYASIRNDVARALKVSDDLSPDALRRLVDYRMTGLTPTVGKLTRDPATFTQEENLMRVGANSKDKAAQALGATKNENNNRLIALLNSSGAGAAGDQIAGAGRVMGALADYDNRAQNVISRLYDRARDSAGRSAPLDSYAFTQRAGDLLHDSNVESFLTPDVRNKLNGFAKGDVPLNVEIAEQFKTSIARLQRNSTDGNVRHALGLVRQALDETPLLGTSRQAVGGNQVSAPGGLAAAAGGQPAEVGQEAINAFNRARRVNREYMGVVERTPALDAVRNGVEPDKFVQQYIVGSGSKANVADVEALQRAISSNPDAIAAVKGQIAAALKKAALNGASDEVGSVSQSGYNGMLNSIGDRKLRMFFSPEEVETLKAIGRVASYEQKAPAGAMVNYSNSGGAIAGLLDRFIDSSLLTKVPGGRMLLQEPIENIVIGMKAKNALNTGRALQGAPRARNPLLEAAGPGIMLSPALLTGSPDDRK